MRKLSLIVVVLLTTSLNLFSQTDSARDELNHIFQYIDKSQIPSGYLDEYGPQFIGKQWLTGVLADSNMVPGMSGFRFLYNDIENAHIYTGATALTPLENVDSVVNQAPSGNATPLIFLTAQYSTLREDAIQQNLFTYSNNQIFDVTNRSQSPYQLHNFFAACPISEVATQQNTLSLTYKTAFVYSNINKPINQVWIDFLDGQGYHYLAPDSVINKTYSDSSGFKSFAIKVVYTDNGVFYCYSRQYVNVSSGQSRYSQLTDAELANPAHISHDANGQYHDAKVYVRYSTLRNGTPSQGKLIKPLIFVEGYDIHDEAPLLKDDNYNINKLTTEWNDLVVNPTTDFDLNKQLDETAGYDLVFVDYYSMDAIENNAKMLQEVIQWVNSQKATAGSSEQNVVMGVSLGGVLARYTLAKMTKTLGSSSTQTRLLITHDSPHQGANVPLGFQDFLYDFGEVRIVRKIKDVSAELRQFYHLNDLPATQELLIARVTNSSGNVSYNSFLSGDYRNTITFGVNDPQPSYGFIATSQGSQCAHWTMNPGTLLAYQDGNVATADWLFYGLLFSNKYKLTVQINALPQYGSSGQISYVKMARNIRLFFGAIGTGWKTTYQNAHNAPSNIIPWDCVPGGTQSASGRSGGSFSNNSVTPDPFSSHHTIFGNLWRLAVYPFFNVHSYLDIPFQQDIFTHVPITSSLDVSNVTINTFNQPFIFPATGANGSAADEYIAQEQFTGAVNNTSATLYNRNHTDFTKRNSEWLYKKMENITPNNLNCSIECSIAQINGNSSICTSEIYNITNLPSGSTVSWGATPSGMVSFSCTLCNSTTITATGSAQVTITATISTPCGNVVLTKSNVHVGGPPVSFTVDPYTSGQQFCTNSLGNTCIINPEPLNDVTGFEWGYSSYQNNINPTVINSSGSYSQDFIFSVGGNYQIYARAYNSCGFGGNVGTLDIFVNDNCSGGGFGRFALMPNPTSGDLLIETKDQKSLIKEIRVLDRLNNMRKQFTYRAGVKSIKIDISSLPIDVYLVMIFDGTSWTTQKIIKR